VSNAEEHTLVLQLWCSSSNWQIV